MLRRTPQWSGVKESINYETGVLSLQADGVPEPLINRLHSTKGSWKYGIKARVFSNSYRKAGLLAVVVGSVGFVMPYGLRIIQELKGSSRFALETADIAMPDLSPAWWKNEWRKGAAIWRSGESTPGFFEENANWIEANTGRRMFDRNAIPVVPIPAKASKKIAAPSRASIHEIQPTDITGQPILGTEALLVSDPTEQPIVMSRRNQMKALVPLSGDSPILTVLLERGYFVDAVECSEVALKSLRQRLRAWTSFMYYGDHSHEDRAFFTKERIVNTVPEHNLRVHWCDFFDPLLWTISPSGMTSRQRQLREQALEMKRLQDLKPKGDALAQSLYDTLQEKTDAIGDSTMLDSLSKKRADQLREDLKGAEMEERLRKFQEDYITKENSSLFDMPPLSRGIKDEKYDFIYDRQGITAVNPADRGNYAYLLKKSLKEDGILFIEGTFRTGRVKGNRIRGPPFQLNERQLAELFPPHQGYNVKCDSEVPDRMFSIDRENRILGRIPKSLYVTPIPCVVWKKAAEDTSRLRELAAAKKAQEAEMGDQA